MSKATPIAAYFVLLFILHQDFWWKGNPALVFDILPVSLAYHVVWTLFVAFGWFLVGKHCWPEKLDDVPPGPNGRSGEAGEDRPVRHPSAS